MLAPQEVFRISLEVALLALWTSAHHFWRSPWRDLRTGLRRDFAVLSRCFGANEARREKLFELLLVELDNERFDRWSKEPEIGLHYDIFVGRETSSQRSRHFLFGWKNSRSKFFEWRKNYNGSVRLQKREEFWVDLPLFNVGFLM